MPFFFQFEIPVSSNHSSRIIAPHTRGERERIARRTIDGTDGHTKNKHMASRVLANLLVACSGAVFRAASQAWSKALQNAKASGVHAEHRAKHAAGKTNVSSKSSKTTSGGGVSLDEAKKILPISTEDTKEQMLAKFDRAFAKNDDVSFYLQSKLFRAKETLGKEVFGMTEEEASADPRKKRKEEDKEGHRKSEGEKTTTTTNSKDALPNDDDKNAPTTTEKE